MSVPGLRRTRCPGVRRNLTPPTGVARSIGYLLGYALNVNAYVFARRRAGALPALLFVEKCLELSSARLTRSGMLHRLRDRFPTARPRRSKGDNR